MILKCSWVASCFDVSDLVGVCGRERLVHEHSASTISIYNAARDEMRLPTTRGGNRDTVNCIHDDIGLLDLSLMRNIFLVL